ncbi:MAG: carboxypeptidase regulatory-like domain-containing protein [Prevotellaceae bacterium]|jgi:outer membrane protein OmpA-like peptidoglycan-associated protein|nr:carboxypeptidase regulatory-like domain-containing protein [Prevotellaceae bacterium]
MRKILVTLIALICASAMFAQSKEMKKAEEIFKAGDYSTAIERYSAILEKSSDGAERAFIRFKIGECYGRLNRPDRAERFFNDAIKNGYMAGDIYMALGDVQQKLGKYDEAMATYELYKLANPGDPAAEVKLASCTFAKENQHNISLFKLERLDRVNSRKSDYGVSYYNESLIFSSTRAASQQEEDKDDKEERELSRYEDRVIPDKKEKKQKTYSKGGLNESRVMLAVGHGNGSFDRPIEIAELNKMKGFADDGVMLYDPFSKKGYYTFRDGNKAYIQSMTVVNNRWEKDAKIEVRSQGGAIGHPFVTSDGNRIYFTSTMPGGKGKSDIWFINRMGENSWSEPINAGDNINTPGNEVYPNVANGYFFFASDGRIGLGGLDIYASKITGGNFERAINLGSPFNSSADDYNLVMRSDLKEGVLVTSRTPRAEDDIFWFEGFPSYVTATGQINDASSGKPISNVSLELFKETKSLGKMISDENGQFMIPISPNTSYLLKATVAGYAPSEKKFTSPSALFGRVNKSSGVDLDFALQGNASVISGRAYDRITAVPLEGTVVSLIADGKVQQTVKVDPSGVYKFTNLKSNTTYTIKADPKEYYMEAKTITVANANQRIEYSRTTGYDLDLALERYEKNKEMIMTNVSFQIDKANLLSESYKELDRIARMFALNPQCKITLTSHVGLKVNSRIANELSMLRAKAIRDYLIAQKVNPAQLTERAMGRQRPLIPNPKTEEEHEQNNRITYMVTRVDEMLDMSKGLLPAAASSSATTQTTYPGTSVGTPSTPTNRPSTPAGGTTVVAGGTTVVAGGAAVAAQTGADELPYIAQIAVLGSLSLNAPDFVKIKTQLGWEVKYKLIEGKYRYYVGGYATRTEAEDAGAKLKSIGINPYIRPKY